MEAVEHRQAEAVDAADHGGIGPAGLDQSRGGGEDLGRGRAGGGDGLHRSGQAEGRGHEGGGGVRRVHPGHDVLGPEIAVFVQFSEGQLRAADAGRGGADDAGHPIGAMALEQLGGRIAKAVLVQSQGGELIVAALESRQVAGQGDLLDAVDPADPGGQVAVRVVVGAQAAAALDERGAQGFEPRAGGAGQGHGGDMQFVHSGRDESGRARVAGSRGAPV